MNTGSLAESEENSKRLMVCSVMFSPWYHAFFLREGALRRAVFVLFAEIRPDFCLFPVTMHEINRFLCQRNNDFQMY